MDPVAECRSLTNPLPSPPEFARTYRGRDGWDRALEYRSVSRYCSTNPQKGSSAVASALEMPRGRIRVWIDGNGAPDPVHGLRTALDRGWLIPDDDARRRRALAVCVAWMFAGGSISASVFTPRFAAHEPAEQDRITDAVSDLGVELLWIDREDDGQGVEAQPVNDASVFGRVLVAAGAPTDPDDVLPTWLREDPMDTRRAVAGCYVECRGQRAGEAGVLQIREAARPDAHLESLGELLVDVAGVGGYTFGGKNLRLDLDATHALLDQIDVDL